MLLAANAFAADEGDPDEQQHEPEPDETAPPRQQADAWAAVADFQRQQQAEGALEEVFHLWPEHEAALQLFQAVETQFQRTNEGLPTGLDYCRVRAHPAFRALPRAEREAVLADVATMEPAWIRERVRLHVDEMKSRSSFRD